MGKERKNNKALCLVTHLSNVNQLLKRSNSEVMWFFFFAEQVLLDQNVQTPPPSPFSIQAFSKGTSCSNGQGFDYGLGNNKGMFLNLCFIKLCSSQFCFCFCYSFPTLLGTIRCEPKDKTSNTVNFVRCSTIHATNIVAAFFFTLISFSLSTLYKKDHQILVSYCRGFYRSRQNTVIQK